MEKRLTRDKMRLVNVGTTIQFGTVMTIDVGEVLDLKTGGKGLKF